MICLARGVLTTGGFEVDPTDRAPANGEHDFRRWSSGSVISWIRHNTSHHDGIYPLQAHRLDDAVVVQFYFLARVFVDVTHDQSVSVKTSTVTCRRNSSRSKVASW